MSWLARSFANSLLLDDEPQNDAAPIPSIPQQQQNDAASNASALQHQQQQNGTVKDQEDVLELNEEEEEEESRGVKEDLSELKETLARQFWGVAQFLAPPPTPRQSQPSDHFFDDEFGPSDFDRDYEDLVSGSKREIGGMDEDQIAEGNLGNEQGVGSEGGINEHYYYYDDGEVEEEEEEDLGVEEAVGITEEVLAFAMNIAHHPETWLDFPLEPEDDLDDFEMSDAQQKHAMAIERLAPRLAALRIELCPCHMNESYFWKVYFVLLHSRLNKNDAEFLSTPQVMEARAMWMQELQKKTKPEPDWWGRNGSYRKDSELEDDYIPDSPQNFGSENVSSHTFASEQSTSFKTIDYEIEKHPVESSEVKFIDKSVIQETPVIKTGDKNLYVTSSSKALLQSYEDDEDDWPEDDSDLGEYSRTTIPLGNEDDISFSDLEDDDDVSKIVSKGRKT